jgi:hypothetical protein
MLITGRQTTPENSSASLKQLKADVCYASQIKNLPAWEWSFLNRSNTAY